jgi:hypothetical protein
MESLPKESSNVDIESAPALRENVVHESALLQSVSQESYDILTEIIIDNKSAEKETKIETAVSAEQKVSIFASIQEKLADQDFQQRSGVTLTVLLELYRVLIASFLILFVPQSCGDHVCTITENAQTGDDHLYNAGFSFNCITLIAFLAMYFAEVKREGKLIAYLDVNPKCKSDNDSVGLVLEKLPSQRSQVILFYDGLYQKTGYFALVCFIINTALSAVVINKYYLDDKTTSTFITSVLFMITKMGDVYSTVKTEKNIFYSAYLKGKVQYNDLDANKVL